MLQRYRRWVRMLVYTTLQGEVGRRLAETQALIADMLAQSALDAIYGASIASGQVPADSLQRIGDERGLPRYPPDSDETYAKRLASAWTAHERTGTAPAIVAQFSALGLTAHVMDMRRWDWDANTAWWSRLWVVVTGHNYSEWTLGPQHVLDGSKVLGIDAAPSDVATWRAIARRWKPGHFAASHIIFVFDMARWLAEQPDGSWDVQENRSTSAVYIPG
jgi:hypothetical protein